ncbi:XTP/dITP diphosphatase [Fonticella tunisiensis]|uniref:dITP/XTP pyrophosphatase n=1 Tax=Fonticella tunisiensis TaxID=1096341 RepID=A0A4R7KNZ2_9CLOT|nr:XTP/dITP diphosphatase [Fonticella tunisiensis]TDT58420.1 XTP/dITP diphosphohydrolase [Fonticella tunisiensis]
MRKNSRIIIASNNKHKVDEIKAILREFPFEILSLKEAGIDIEVDEDGKTFEENALKKAVEVMKVSGEMALADDSGLEVYALDGEPGVYSARFAGEHGNDKKNNKKLLNLLKNVPDEERGARFVSIIALVSPDGEQIIGRGYIEGKIGYEEKGKNGFGYDPLFIVPELNKTFGELTSEEKNLISHRSRALADLKSKLKKIL